MRRILILSNLAAYTYDLRKDLIKKLLDLGVEVYIAVPFGDKIGLLKKMGCRCINISLDHKGTSPLNDIRLFFNYFKIIKKVKPDAVLTYTIKPNIYGGFAALLLKISYLANITGLGTPLENSGFVQRLSVFLYKIVFRKVSCVFFQNTENMQFFKDMKIPINKKILLPGSGVNLEHFSLSEYPEDEEIHFAFISRIMKEKGVDQYLTAAKAIKKKYPYVKFHVCGPCEDEYVKSLENLQKSGVIQYHGKLLDVREILRKVQCVVHPSYYPEGISNILLESCATGRPVITTNRSGCREVVEDGVTGYIVRQQNSADLEEKIEKFILLPYEIRKKMGEAARLKVEREFDRKIVVESYVQALNDIWS